MIISVFYDGIKYDIIDKEVFIFATFVRSLPFTQSHPMTAGSMNILYDLLFASPFYTLCKIKNISPNILIYITIHVI